MYVLRKTDKTSGKTKTVMESEFFVKVNNAITNELMQEGMSVWAINNGWKNKCPKKKLGMTWENDKVRYDIVE